VPASPTRRAPPFLWLLFGLAGRISRRVYWLAYLFIICVQSVLLAQILGQDSASFHDLAASIGPFGIMVTLYWSFAVSVKRLHDVGYAGFLALALLIPFVNVAFTIWIGLLPGTTGPNRFGDHSDVAPA
jgi:uncharacterized membrane protein YhaH (DUF805 family)